jgi:Ca2+-binding RTX toxin-like protein
MPTVSIPLKLVSDIVVNSATAGDQVNPIVERLADGNYVVVWTDNSHGAGGAGGDSDGTAVKGQLLAPDGSKVGSEFLVNVTTAGNQVPTDVVPLYGGGFAVLWDSVIESKVRTFDANGTPTSGEVLFPGGADLVVSLAGGGFVRAFGEGDFSVYDSNFQLVAGPIDPGAGDDHYQQTGTVIPLSNGDFAFVWGQAFTFNGPTPLPKLVIYHADGTPASGVVSLAGGGIIPLVASGFALDNDNVVVVAAFPAGNTGVSLVSPSGTVLWQMTFEHATAAPLDDGGFVVSYTSGGTSYVQEFDADGSADGPPVNATIPADDSLTVVGASDGSGQGIHSRYSQAVPNDATEQVNLSLKDLQMSVNDTGSPHTATLSVDYGVLFVTPGTSGAAVSGSGTDTVTITGTIAQINSLLNTDPTSTVDYQANTDDPPAETVLTLSLGTATASAIIHIIDVNDTGTAADDAVATDEGTTITITPTANDSDPDGNTLATVNGVALAIGQSTTLASGAIVTRTGAETLSYDPNAAFDGLIQGATDTDSFGYTINGGSSATVTVTINGLAGTSWSDFLDVSAGVGATIVGGGRGDDVFYFRGEFTADDNVDGGDGSDQLRLDGDYSAGLTLGATTLVNVEQIFLTAIFSYDLTTADENVAAGEVLSVIGTQLGHRGETLIFDGSAETDGRFSITGGDLGDRLTGGAGDDLINGEAGADMLDGGAGSDTTIGGVDDDIYAVDSLGDAIIEAGGQGSDRVYASATYRLTSGAEVELLTAANQGSTAAIDLAGNEFGQAIFGSDGANLLEGLGGDDGLYGLGGSDTIDGGTGGDQMHGGTGDDIYYVDNAGDNVVEAAGAGSDQVVVLASFRLGSTSEVEFLSALSAPGTGTIDIAGSDSAQTIWGHAGSNSLEGLGGDDTLFGMGGNDTLDGGTGTNILQGGAGDDTYAVSGQNDFVTEAAGEGNDRILAYGSYSLAVGSAVELLTAANQNGTQALNLTGNGTAQSMIGNEGVNELYGLGGADVLFGLGGNDVLDGGSGADVARGGAGDDAYAIDDSLDQVIEVAGEGYDRLFTTVDYRIGESQHIELLVGDQASGAALNLAGNNLSNTIVGNGGANLLEGHGGVDRLEGGGGNDTLDGGSEGDVLNGGAGADQFRFTSALDGNFDRIEDFLSGTDKIGLSRTVFTGLAAGSVPAGAFVLGSAAADGDDRLVYNQATGQLFYDADGNGSGAAVLFATLQPGTVLAASDFVVL